MILAGDVGGTKSHLALVKSQGGKISIVWEKRYASGDFSSFNALINQLKKDLKLDQCNLKQLTHSVFAIAGPIHNNSCHTTNLPWFIDGEQLSNQLGVEEVRLLNDVEAIALGIPHLNRQQLVPLTPWTQGEDQKAIALIAPGTGLGESALFWTGKGYQAQASEGGHKDFTACSTQEFALKQFAAERFKGHVSIERILGGDGFTLIYDFLRHKGGTPANEVEDARGQQSNTNAIITHLALTKQNALCEEVLALYVSLLAAECANLALQYMSLGGVVIAGGIPPKILPALLRQGFLTRYLAKGRYKSILETIPVFVCTEERSALIGAAGCDGAC